MAPKKKSPDAQKVEKFLDDLRTNMHDRMTVDASAPLKMMESQPTFKDFLASLAGLCVQAVLYGVLGGVALRIVRVIAGF